MPETPRTSPPEPAPSAQRAGDAPDLDQRRATLAKVIPRRPSVAWWLAIVLAVGFAALATPTITAERWLLQFGPGSVAARQPAPFTVRAPMLAGYEQLRVRGGVVVARGEIVAPDQAAVADSIALAIPRGPMLYLAFFALTLVLAGVFSYHMRRSVKGRLVRVQVVNLVVIGALAVIVKLLVLSTTLSALVVPVALLAMVPTMALDRVVGIATGVLAALVVSLQAPFDVGLAILLLVQAATAGLVVAEHPRRRWTAALGAGLVTTLCTGATYFLLTFLTTGSAPELHDPLHSPWIAAAVGPALAAVVAVPLLPLYQLLVGEITQGRLFALEDLGHPLLRQIAEKAPGTWQHSLMMANMAEIAANAIGASGRLVRVGAYFHDLGKSLSPKYFIENLEPGETSPHDQLPPEVSCDAIFAHVTLGIAAARKAGLHERIVDFMHMHHGNGVLEYFWARCREQGNPRGFTALDFRYPGHPPQSRETAILAICDAVEAASRTLKKPDAASIDSLVQRIVYGKLHLGQLDESDLSMGDLRRISDSLRETIRHANHGRIEYPWQKAGQDASASVMTFGSTSSPRLDSLDRRPVRESAPRAPQVPPPIEGEAALASTADVKRGASAPAEYAAQAGEPGDPRIRAGTARNAVPSGPPAGDAGRAREVRAEDVRAAEERDAQGYAETSYVEMIAFASERPAAPAPTPPGRITDRGTGIRDPGSGPIHGSAPVGDRDAPARDRAGPTRDLRATAPDGVAPLREPAAVVARALPGDDAGREIVTERDGVVPIRDPGSAPDREPRATLRDGLSPLRDSSADPSPRAGRDGAPPDPGTTLRDAAAPRRHDPTPAPLARAANPQGLTTLPGRAPGPQAPTSAPASAFSPDPHALVTTPGRAPGPQTTAGEPDSAPSLSFGSSGHPSAPSDPAHLAAALASLASRVSAAPFGPSSAVDPPPRPAATDLDRTLVDRTLVDRTLVDRTHLDRTLTRPSPPGAVAPRTPRSSGLASGSAAHEATTRPVVASGRAASAHEGTTEPVLTSASRPAGSAEPPVEPVAVKRRASAESGPEQPRRPARPGEVPRARPGAQATARPTARPGTPPTLHTLHDGARVIIPPRAEPIAALAPGPDAGATDPSMPMLVDGDEHRAEPPLRAAPRASTAPVDITERTDPWAAGLAARVDAALDFDEWSHATPIASPTKAELRALLGRPDPTRQLPREEVERLQRHAAELGDAEPPRRSPHPTAEVDPDDIE
ncbi:MAG TPA: HDIG domain-containing protein, partial [Kofleriaceae bacterium]|nr:HDIG domain-containing protein [Kofleriaceae bacterium]